jgi:hypothetical protein
VQVTTPWNQGVPACSRSCANGALSIHMPASPEAARTEAFRHTEPCRVVAVAASRGRPGSVSLDFARLRRLRPHVVVLAAIPLRSLTQGLAGRVAGGNLTPRLSRNRT